MRIIIYQNEVINGETVKTEMQAMHGKKVLRLNETTADPAEV